MGKLRVLSRKCNSKYGKMGSNGIKLYFNALEVFVRACVSPVFVLSNIYTVFIRRLFGQLFLRVK